MNQVRLITAADFASDCPVPLDLLTCITRSQPADLAELLNGIPEVTRALLAIWLYGRSHTHEIGVRVAATCEHTSLRRAAGYVGDQLYEMSRRPYTTPNHGLPAVGHRRHVSLGGPRSAPSQAMA